MMFFFYWLVAIMPLDEHWLWGKEILGNFTIIKALGLMCLLIAFFRLLTRGASPRMFYSRQARWFIAFVCLLCVSLAHPLASPSTAYSHVFSVIALLPTIVVLVDSRPRLYYTLLVAMGAVGLASLYAIRQQQAYGALWAGFRAGGVSGDSNYYALTVGVLLPLAFLWAFSRRPLWERLLCFGCVITTFLGTTFAASRGAFLGTVAAFLYLTLRSGRPVRNLALVGLLMVPLLLTVQSSALQRLEHPNDGDVFGQNARLTTWKAGLRMIQAHPLTGVGLHNFKTLVSEYEDPDQQVITLAHNTYIEIAAEAGIPALFAFLGVLLTAFHALERVRRRMKQLKAAHLSNIALGLQAGLLSYMVSAFFVSAWWAKPAWLLIFLTICIDTVSHQAEVSKREGKAIRPLDELQLTHS